MGIGVGFGLGPLRVSNRGVRVGGGVGPISASANLTPRLRARRGVPARPKPVKPRSAPPPTKVDKAAQKVYAGILVVQLVTMVAPLATKKGRREAPAKIEKAVNDFNKSVRNLFLTAVAVVSVLFFLFLVFLFW